MRSNPTILMNAQDASPGSGAAPASVPPAAPAQAPAATGHDMTVSDFVDSLMEDPARRNGFFAEARKRGLLGPTKTKSEPSAAAPAPAKAPTDDDAPLSRADVQAMLGREREFGDVLAGLDVKLSTAQRARLRRAFEAERPTDVVDFVSSWVSDMGIGAASASATTTPPPTAPAAPPRPATAVPATHAASPPPPKATLEERNAFDFSDADRDAFVRQHGAKKYADKILRDAKQRRVTLGR